MAYVKLVDYQAKDALITGNPAKKVSGTELGAEFDAIAAASALTVDLSSTQTLTNKTLTSPVLTTPALGTPSSGIATNLTGTATALNIGGNAATANTATTATNLSNGSAGTIPYQSAAGTTAMLAAGTAGQVLESNGAAAPVYAWHRQIQSISASVGSNALTISASAMTLEFRDTTLGSGTVTKVTGTPSNLVISSGSTLGTTSAIQSDIVVVAINNAGTIELAAVNAAGGNDLSESGLISTTAEGGAGAADSINVFYSTTARTNVAYRVLGILRSTQATAGTWATAPSLIQGSGGLFTPRSGQMELLQTLTASSSASIELKNLPVSNYSELQVVGKDIVAATNAVELNLTLSVDNGATYQTAASSYAVARKVLGADTVDYSAASSATTVIGHVGAGNLLSNGAQASLNFHDTFMNFDSTSKYKQVIQDFSYAGTIAGAIGNGNGLGISATLYGSAVNAVKYAMSSGNIASGTFYLYGRRK